MEQKIYYVKGVLDRSEFKVTATEIAVKETPQNYRIIDGNGSLLFWSMIPKKMVEEGAITDRRFYNNFDSIQYEAFCFYDNVDAVVLFMKEKIHEQYRYYLRRWEEVQENVLYFEHEKIELKKKLS